MVWRPTWGDGSGKSSGVTKPEEEMPVIVPRERHADWGDGRNSTLEESYRIILDSGEDFLRVVPVVPVYDEDDGERA